MSRARALIDGWALLGGLLLSTVTVMNVASILGDALFGAPTPGDYEMTEIGVAVAAFMCLPYCQLHRRNVSADIFTSRASPRWIARMSLLGSSIALLFGALLAWRMYDGMTSKRLYNNVTTVLQFPEWLAFPPILVSLALLVLAAAITLTEDARASIAPK